MRKNFPFTKTATELTYLGKAKDLVTGVPLVGKYIEAFGKGAGKGIEALETGVNVAASFASYPLVDLATGGRLYKDRTADKSKYFYPGIDASPEVLRRLQQENA